MKDFKGQYSDEKLLLKKNEDMLSFLLSRWYLFFVYLIFVAIALFISNYFELLYIGVIISIFILFIFFIYMKRMYKNTFFILSSRRVIKSIRNGIFMQHKKELKLLDIKAVSSKRSFIETIFGYGTIKIQGTERDSDIYFKGLRGYTDVLNYISRVLDYIKLNGHTDDIAKYKSKKERK